MDVFSTVASGIALCDMIMGYIQTAEGNKADLQELQQQIPTTKQLLYTLSPKVANVRRGDQADLEASIGGLLKALTEAAKMTSKLQRKSDISKFFQNKSVKAALEGCAKAISKQEVTLTLAMLNAGLGLGQDTYNVSTRILAHQESLKKRTDEQHNTQVEMLTEILSQMQLQPVVATLTAPGAGGTPAKSAASVLAPAPATPTPTAPARASALPQAADAGSTSSRAAPVRQKQQQQLGTNTLISIRAARMRQGEGAEGQQLQDALAATASLVNLYKKTFSSPKALNAIMEEKGVIAGMVRLLERGSDKQQALASEFLEAIGFSDHVRRVLDEPEAVFQLADLLQSGSSPAVRAAAGKAIQRLLNFSSGAEAVAAIDGMHKLWDCMESVQNDEQRPYEEVLAAERALTALADYKLG